MKSGSTSKGVGNGAINTEQSESSDAEASIGQYTKGTPLEECQRSSTIEVIAGATNETIEEHENQPEISSENVNEYKISIAIRKRNLPEGEIAKDILQPKKKCIEKKSNNMMSNIIHIMSHFAQTIISHQGLSFKTIST